MTIEQSPLEQAPFSDVEFEQNAQPRCPVVILLDNSGSMKGQPIAELNGGLKIFETTLKADKLASLRVEIALVTFGGYPQPIDVRVDKSTSFDPQVPFVTADNFEAPTITISGDTPMCAAIREGVTMLSQRKEVYKRNGIDYYRPWLMLITDGQPTDRKELTATVSLVQQEEAQKHLVFYPIGVQNANMHLLESLGSQHKPMKLAGLEFGKLFQWLSNSLSKLSASNPGEQISLPAVDWGTVDTGVN